MMKNSYKNEAIPLKRGISNIAYLGFRGPGEASFDRRSAIINNDRLIQKKRAYVSAGSRIFITHG
jgi:hypothetical protein